MSEAQTESFRTRSRTDFLDVDKSFEVHTIMVLNDESLLAGGWLFIIGL